MRLLGPRLSTSRIMRYIRCRCRPSAVAGSGNKVVPYPMQLSPLSSARESSIDLFAVAAEEDGSEPTSDSSLSLSLLLVRALERDRSNRPGDGTIGNDLYVLT
jgi:hypothetical protein